MTELQWVIQFLAIGAITIFVMHLIYEVCIYLKRGKCLNTKEDVMGLQVKWEQNDTKYVKKHISEFNKGDVIMNAFHDPESPKRAGLYLILNNGNYLRDNPQHQDKPFAIGLKSGNVHTYETLYERFHRNHLGGFGYLCTATIHANLIRR